MFNNREIFFAVCGALALVLFFLILFEKKLIAFEDKCKKALKEKMELLRFTAETQKEIIALQDEVIHEQADIITKLKKALRTQEKINSINLETLRQERLKNSREVKE